MLRMNPLIKPVYLLMNRLTYRGKFILIASLFGVPLALFGARVVLDLDRDMQRSHQALSILDTIQRSNDLISDFEVLRDYALSAHVFEDSPFAAKFSSKQQALLEKLTETEKSLESLEQKEPVVNLKIRLLNHRAMAGNEGEQIDTFFENYDSLVVQQAYRWRERLSYEFASVQEQNSKMMQVITMLDNSSEVFRLLGEVRAYGSFYLQRGYLDSLGISLLDEKVVALTRIIESEGFDRGDLIFDDLIDSLKEQRVRALIDAKDALEEQLIFPMQLVSNSVDYFDQISISVGVYESYRAHLLRFARQIIEQDIETDQQDLRLFYAACVLAFALAIYLFIGFYMYVQTTIDRLVKAADRVSRGEYDKSIKIVAKDEMRELSVAMDKMRETIKAREDELEQIGQTDGLTQLKNRKFFDESLPISLANRSRNSSDMTLVMIDIDHFKTINDKYGHQAGDEVLRQVALSISEHFKRKSDIVARFGGEEFVAILLGWSEMEARSYIEALRQRIELLPIIYEGNAISVTASFGAASVLNDAKVDAESLLGEADAALYQAKDLGRNRVVHRSIGLQ